VAVSQPGYKGKALLDAVHVTMNGMTTTDVLF
jgi:hypothetical protein